MKKNLGKIIALSLLTASVFSLGTYGVASAKEYNTISSITVNEPDEDINIDWTNGYKDVSPIWIGADITAKSLQIINPTNDETNGKGINAYAHAVTVNAKSIIIDTYDDGIFTTGRTVDGGALKPGELPDVKINGFDLLKIKSINGYGIVNNGNGNGPRNGATYGGVYVNGNAGSTIYISNGKNRAAVGEMSDQTTDIRGGNVLVETENQSKGALYAGFGKSWTSGGTLNVTADNLISLDNKVASYAVNSTSKGTINVNADKKASLKVNGKVNASSSSTVNANFIDEKSFLNGAIVTTLPYRWIAGGTTNIEFTNGALWNVAGDSNVTNLTVDDKTVINMSNNENLGALKVEFARFNDQDNTISFEAKDIRKDAKASKVTIDNSLTGTGSTFVLDLDATNKNTKHESDTSDYIYLNGTSEGAHNIYFDVDASKISTDMNVGDKLYFAYVKDGNATFDSAVDLEKVSAENIYDYKYGVDKDANTDKQGNDWYIGLTDKTENENITSVDGAMKAGYALGTEMDRLNKRLGESRYLSDEKGLWVRYRHARVGMDNSFKTNSNMFQLGYDKQVLEDDGTYYRGLALDYTHGDTSLLGLRGNGEHDRYSLSLYDTWTGDKGHYRDLVIRGGRINSEFDVDNSNSETISSDYHQWFGSISGEWGRKKDTGHDWYFEPQTQLQLARVGGADYVTNHGVRVEQDGATSLIGRLGFRLGREFDKNDAAKRDNYYIKADLLHEFCGDQEYRVTGKDGSLSKTYDGKDTWFDVGVGADITISRNTYFWVDVERTLGGDFDRTWQVNGGFRWEF